MQAIRKKEQAKPEDKRDKQLLRSITEAIKVISAQ